MTDVKSMGIGPLGRSDMVFVRKFRWTLQGKDFDDNVVLDEHWFKTLNIDFSRNQLDFQAYEVISKDAEDLQIQEWLDKESHDSELLMLTTYDGCGNPLYKYTFFNPVVVHDTLDFDYANSEESVRKVSVKFEDYTRTFVANDKHKHVGPLKKKYIWKMRLKDGPAIKVSLGSGRPQLSIEEAEINFLNAKTFIPGKASWKSLHVTLPQNHQDSGILKALLDYEPGLGVYLDLYTMDGSTHLETWLLKDVWMQSVKTNDNEVRPRIIIRFGVAEYMNTQEIQNENR